jgi:hypothetical protein
VFVCAHSTPFHLAISVAAVEAAVLLRLFKIVFSSVAMFPQNEAVLATHLQTIVLSCLDYASKVKQPVNYLQVGP